MEEVKTAPVDDSSVQMGVGSSSATAPELAARGLDKELGIFASAVSELTTSARDVNDLTKLVKKKKKVAPNEEFATQESSTLLKRKLSEENAEERDKRLKSV